MNSQKPGTAGQHDLRQNLRQHQLEFDSMISLAQKQSPFLLSNVFINVSGGVKGLQEML